MSRSSRSSGAGGDAGGESLRRSCTVVDDALRYRVLTRHEGEIASSVQARCAALVADRAEAAHDAPERGAVARAGPLALASEVLVDGIRDRRRA